MNFTPKLKFQLDDNTFLNYDKYGNGKTSIVFLAGFGQATYSWDSLKEKLDFDLEKYSLYFIDLLGFGHSSKNKAEIYSISNQAKVILATFNFLRIEEVILIGHWFGGLVSLSIVKLVNETKSNVNIKSLILFDTPAYLGSEPSFVKLLRNKFLSFIGTFFYSPRQTALQTIKNTFYDFEEGAKLFFNLYNFFYSLEGYYNSMVMVANQTTENELVKLSDHYSKINIPTLLIWGKDDKMIPISFGEKLSSDIKTSVLKSIENCGHIPLQEKPNESAQIINQFYKETIL